MNVKEKLDALSNLRSALEQFKKTGDPSIAIRGI